MVGRLIACGYRRVFRIFAVSCVIPRQEEDRLRDAVADLLDRASYEGMARLRMARAKNATESNREEVAIVWRDIAAAVRRVQGLPEPVAAVR